MANLFSYKLMVDTGFAPNPYGSTLTLATCKPDVRKTRRVGDWIAGFTSQGLSGDAVGQEKLLYLMRIGEKMRIGDYYHDPRFQDKIPQLESNDASLIVGDNIYKPKKPNALSPNEFEQLPNCSHNTHDDRTKDVKGEFVLVAGEFYYFGRNALKLPEDVRPDVPRTQSRFGQRTGPRDLQLLLDYVQATYAPGRHGIPYNIPTFFESAEEFSEDDEYKTPKKPHLTRSSDSHSNTSVRRC